MDPSWTPVLGWAFATLLVFIFLPPLSLMAFRRIQHTLRRKMVNGPRKIKVGRDGVDSDDPCANGHHRSKRNVKEGANGVYVSVCRTCGARMRRNGPGDWEVVG